ncbi:uncharacterized protein J4E79_010904 [Alternaria viburni]|uniref:uncharacterized protein n=1 Tax=Alternaria viburni TaxID=566460 RepID=UPI0020C3AF0B|nr:uncharacterized protein J4E79_010904 [Alternaria viburni]KAI4645365.1 hypothetical protein J4E79_010904 [Alternaria viburni]
MRRPEYPSWTPLGWAGSVKFADVLHQLDLSVKDADNLSNPLLNWSEGEHRVRDFQHIQITVKVHPFPVVNITRSKLVQTWDWGPSERERSFLVLTIGTALGNGGDVKLYMHIHWDVDLGEDYDSSQITCAVTHDQNLRYLSIMVLRDLGTHYERIGIALANPEPGDTGIIQAVGLDELIGPATGIQTLSAGDTPNVYWRELKEEFINAIPHTKFPIKPFLPALQIDFTTTTPAHMAVRRRNKYRYGLGRDFVNVVI